MRKTFLAGCLLMASLATAFASNQQVFVKNAEEFKQAVAKANSGDEIVLNNGEWRDSELLVQGMGTEANPIVVRAESDGGVILSGESNLRIAGEHLIIQGLVFKNGYTPTSEVISFKQKDGVYANNCRLTNCVIDNYNGPERFDRVTWVALYGKNNRVDHCYFTGKRNAGVTMTIRLIDELCQNNGHLIERNHFGYRQNLGSNGGETLRIGTSKYSLKTSGTTVSKNLFEQCSGETEIISIKSCGNRIVGNTILESKGAVVFRHGNDNVIEHNHFIGNRVPHTGGVRVINMRNKVLNNTFDGLTGTRFRGALVVMNGVPNSPINRYHQVVGGEVRGNIFRNCDSIQLCAGSDNERSATPEDTLIADNLFSHDDSSEIFDIHDNIDGIEFFGNQINGKLALPDFASGFEEVDAKEGKFGSNQPLLNRENVGVEWYGFVKEELSFDTGTTVFVPAGINTLYEAVEKSSNGDVLVLAQNGEYLLNKKIKIRHPLTIQVGEGNSPASVMSKRESLFIIENEGALKLVNLILDGSKAPDSAGNALIQTSKYSMNRNYKLIAEQCVVQNLNVNHSFSFLKAFSTTFADLITISNCDFKNVSGHILELDKETEELGKYNAEEITLNNCRFENVQGSVSNVLRGGTDESTFGPSIVVSECEFKAVGQGKRNKKKASIFLHGVQYTKLDHLSFSDAAPVVFEFTNGDPKAIVSNSEFNQSGGILSNSEDYFREQIVLDGTALPNRLSVEN